MINKEIIKTEKRNISCEKINDILCKYLDLREVFINSEKISTETIEGVCTIEEFEKLNNTNNISGKIDVDWMYEKVGYIIPIPKSIIREIMAGELHISECHNYLGNNLELDDYYIYNYVAWQLADLNKEAVPYPIYFDYINGRVNNIDFDLDKVLEFMKNDSRFMPAKFYKKEKLEIMNIPYYNADDEFTGRQAIEFCYMPTKEEMYKYYNKSGLGKYEFTRELLKDFIKK